MKANIIDVLLLKKSLVEEDATTENWALTCCLVEINTSSAALEQRTTDYALNDRFLTRLVTLYVSGRDDKSETLKNIMNIHSSAAAESSAWVV